MWKAAGRAAGPLVVSFLLAGCGDLIPRGVEVLTDPPGATVRLGDEKVGQSPVLISLARIKDHGLDTLTLIIEKEGYETRRVILDQRVGVLRVPLKKK
ncbi:MAG: PEGA domain-containing protein [Candidatus Tectomicrobia bacterium]|nr:PEGA domain-containing protein [Candidatus Tectomicrobia bacterium]MBI2176919.1 PEGA domain-containing protein [Candidatus Tectomicrobia bacterium]MBI3025562.1 PEGA domain-containing protein [Candidatus Tectomicrobia bacterium]